MTRFRLLTASVALLGALTVLPGVAPAQDAALDVAIAGRAVQQGEVLRLDVTCACGAAAPHASVFDTAVSLVRVGDTTWRGLVGIDLETAPGAYPLTVRGTAPGAPERVLDLEVLGKDFPTRQLRVAPQFVEPPEAEVERILREAGTLQALFGAVTSRGWNAPFVAPVGTRVSSNFGARSVFNGQPRSPHGGVDFSARTGTPVTAPAGGYVALAEDLYFTGRTVVIDHGAGVFSLLAHLSTFNVTAGDLVERGAVVGRSGATGRVTAPHLHWTVRVNGARVDPLSLLEATRPES